MIPLLLQAAAGRREHFSIFGTDYPTPDGTAVRDYIHVEDLGDAHLLALDAPAPGRHEIYNLGNGAGFSVREVDRRRRERVTGRAIPTREEDRAPRRPAAARGGEREDPRASWAGSRSKPELETMIADAWEWAQAHPDGYAEQRARTAAGMRRSLPRNRGRMQEASGVGYSSGSSADSASARTSAGGSVASSTAKRSGSAAASPS